MAVVYWVVLVLSAPFTGMKIAQVQKYYKLRRNQDARQQMIGAAIALVCGAALLAWSLYHIWSK